MKMKSIYLFLQIVYLYHVIAEDDPVVVTNVGTFRGLKGDGYSSYLGIPYARVNESNYFGDSLPYPRIEGIFEAIDDTQLCPQREDFFFTLAGSLDCLRVNVYVPDRANSTNRLPVLIWFFGGRFEIGFYGSFNFGPQYLIRHDIIFVSVNYRLGPYGFMCLDIPEVPGNQGLKDQARAIKWVKDNIADFGGDPDKITIAGNSAGSMSVGLHLVSDDEKNFNSAIMQSGSALFLGMLKDSDRNVPIELARRFGFHTKDLHKALNFIQNANINEVILAAEYTHFRPCVEKKFDGVPSFLTDYPMNLKQTKAKDMAILQGYTEWEGLIDYGPSTFNLSLFYQRLKDSFNFDRKQLDEAELLVKRFYIGDEEMDERQKWNLLEFTSDFDFVYPAMRALDKYFDSGAEKVYQYVFAYDGQRNFVKIRRDITEPGTAHGDDLGYLFNMTWTKMPPPNQEEQMFIDKFTALWANFVKYSDPTPELTKLLPVKWEPITKGSAQHYLKINTNLTAGKSHFHRRMNFWKLFYQAYGKLEKGFKGKFIKEKSINKSSLTVCLSNVVAVISIFVSLRATF